jgi:hypothetical protein
MGQDDPACPHRGHEPLLPAHQVFALPAPGSGHVVFKPRRLTAEQLEAGYWRAYREFYRWSSIWRAASSKVGLRPRLRHLAHAGGWKKFEPLWDLLIRTKQVLHALPVLETILTGFGSRPGSASDDDSDREVLVRTA